MKWILLLAILLFLAGCQTTRPSFLTRVHENCVAGDQWACHLLASLARAEQKSAGDVPTSVMDDVKRHSKRHRPGKINSARSAFRHSTDRVERCNAWLRLPPEGSYHQQPVEIIALPRKPSFSKHIRDARLRRGLTAAQVAEQVGVSQSSIYFWEADRVRPRDANLRALCKVLKLPIRATRDMAAA